MKYFISDTHFFHENIIKFSNRPFDSVVEMNQTMINKWNSVIGQTDEIYILGDLVVRGTGKQANEILKLLNGKKYLIKGNHEHYLDDPEFDSSHFEWIKDYYSFKFNKKTFVLFHYPILEWNGFYNDSIHLYGHVHHKKKEYLRNILGSRAINVGVDVNNFFPISIEQVLSIVKLRENKLLQ
ncbi:metallophosphoesterase [Salipaludibacillus agaradhaerens]|jgi:calcineurin-like phosphoesterase family protein|uniref:Metallophosphoesterase n=1 Tax=Salipaludibacillus agaradhaerens TaxID=76935 RepID=A0A9Q4B3A9_SALAG|nr:metallophosphoesterase [Salipaludibacillus agaradhaerens]MCR6097180.1 metallophosphoesterase [Salipaludibacillus agaradhaerens]MCR6113335.1 metallophosphoesterase [Salipaludibacillus agaradhaerens]